ELDRARRAVRRELDDGRRLAVQPPPQARVELLSSVDVRDREDDDLDLHVDVRDVYCPTHVVLPAIRRAHPRPPGSCREASIPLSAGHRPRETPWLAYWSPGHDAPEVRTSGDELLPPSMS